MKFFESERRSWALVAVLLLLGLACVLLAGTLALRFSPSWSLPADMRSNLNPDSDYLTFRPNSIIPPVDPSILTQPVWINIFLTPGAVVPTRVPVQDTLPPPPVTPTLIVSAVPVTPTVAGPTPTNTFVYFPTTPTATSRPVSSPAPTFTPTSIPSPTNVPLQVADLQITKTDGTSWYTPNGSLTYTVTIMNKGPANVTGAVLTDSLPVQISSWNWACTSQSGDANGCTGMSGSANFSNMINMPANSGITYTVSAIVPSTASGDLVNTASISLPAGYTDPDLANNVSTDTDSPGIDLQITKTDGVTTYAPGNTLTYTIIVTNNSMFTVNDAIVTDLLPAQITAANWSCQPGEGANCTAVGTGNINDVIDLPPGLAVTYTITGTASSYAFGPLTNTASVAAPAGFVDVAPGNNSASDSNTTADSEPDVGPPDSAWISIPQGSAIVMLVSPAVVADGDVGTPDLVYYERLAAPANPTSVELDWVQVEVSSDGNTWYSVFYWGDPGSSPDANTNVNVQADPPNGISDICSTEVDNCIIPQDRLHNSTGITIDIDSIVPPGSYPWIRITSPASPDASEVDALQPYYP